MENRKIDKQNVADILSLSTMQEGILFHYLSNPGTEEYFSQLSLNISGQLKLEIFEQAWNFVIENNEILRTVYRWEDIKKPVQIVLKHQPLMLRKYDYTATPGERTEIIAGHLKNERAEKFDLETGPLFRVSLCKFADDNHEMVLNNHHILYDGWSMGIILKEFFAAYNAFSAGQTPARPEKNKFKEYLRWLSSQDSGSQSTYWRKYLQGYQTPTLLPIDNVKKTAGNTVNNQLFRLPAGLTAKIEERAKELKVTVSSIINTAWGILLQKYNNTNQVIFGVTIAGRPGEIPGIEDMAGLFINTVPQILRTAPAEPISALIKAVNDDATDRQTAECASLVEIKACSEMDTRENLFDSIVVIENFTFFEELKNAKGDLQVNSYTSFEMPNFDLTVEVVLLKDIEVNFIYNQELFASPTIARLFTHLTNLLTGMVENLTQSVSELTMLSPEEKQLLLFDFNNNVQSYDKNKTIHQLFEEQAAKTPNRIALEFRDKCVTYQDLNARANQLARLLQKYGVQKESIVGIMMERSLEMVQSLLAILKAGGAYLPIDPEYPAERVLYMLENSGAKVLLTNSHSAKNVPFTALQNFEANKEIQIAVTNPREHIKEFDQLPLPDRSLLDLSKYKNKIGMASINNCIALQTTRGCPYKCLYCHKIWSKHHVRRSAENMFSEINYYYQNGVRNFAVIDDCFNLDMENSARLFKLIIANKLKVQIFFPNGLRGDILTPDYIDLMVEAGTRGINLSLETASPRLQKLLMKHLDLDKFRNVVEYIATKHPEIILEMATMHGFPTETEEEAMMTLNFIKDIKWLHFPYIHILKIFPNTEMEEFALAHGIAKEDILKSKNRAFHELPETLPFPKAFTRQYQGEFLNEYFLNKDRLRHVIPVQMRILDESALAQKYNAYLPVEIKTIRDVLKFAEIEDLMLPADIAENQDRITIFDRKPAATELKPGAKKILFLDLSQHFSSHSMLYKVVEQPIGLVYLLTYLKQEFGEKIDGRVYKSGNDFDSFAELKALVDEYKPDMVGIRTLTFFKEFFHETVALLRQWGVTGPIITGGPYASSDYDTILKDKNVNLVAFGEGEYTLKELVQQLLTTNFQMPDKDSLQAINGIAFAETHPVAENAREVLVLDNLSDCIAAQSTDNLQTASTGEDLAYVMYTSGTTGKPKGIMVEHRHVNNCINWMQQEFKLDENAVVVQRTNLTFDPSVWEIFWPLYLGASVKLLSTEEGKDAEFLINLLSNNSRLTMMYVPASMVTGMTYILNSRGSSAKLKMPWFLIGAEPISMDVVKNFYNYLEGQIVNTYGPTECTINNTYYYLNPADERSIVPIGKPVANNQLYILSKDLQPMPLMTPGEICIAGDSVARGYLHNPEKTKESFVVNPFGPGKMYKTGDVGRWLSDGSIEIMGRMDNQVKIRGYRIEPGEIETSLLKHNDIRNCAVIVRDSKEDKDEVKVCKRCGITTAYPNITINEDGFCNVCQNVGTYIEAANAYFRTLDDLKDLIAARKSHSKYDCIILYAGGRASAYALYHLKAMGVTPLVATYDNGWFGPGDIENVKKFVAGLGFDHHIFTRPNSDAILKESLAAASTVCKGCFQTSSSLATKLAKDLGIKVVIGATLSRGQIIENKLYKFFKQGITDVAEIESELLKIQKQSYALDENIYELIGIDEIKDGSIFDEIKVVDFYRFCDVTNKEMIAYLNNRDPYWIKRKNYAIYSTNCPIKQIGDYCHLQEKNFHYYGSATSWEKRLGHLSLENVKEDLHCFVTPKAYENFLRKIGYDKDKLSEKIETKYLAAYYEAEEEIAVSDLREHLLESVPEYMIPTYFTRLDKLPLDPNGKIDRKALPKPTQMVETGIQYVAPRNDLESRLVEIWQNLLHVERVGIKDSFFALGGNSLSIIKLNEEVNKVLEHEVKLMDLFKHHTIEMFMEFYENKYGNGGGEERVTMESILERFKRGEITMDEADQLIADLSA